MSRDEETEEAHVARLANDALYVSGGQPIRLLRHDERRTVGEAIAAALRQHGQEVATATWREAAILARQSEALPAIPGQNLSNHRGWASASRAIAEMLEARATPASPVAAPVAGTGDKTPVCCNCLTASERRRARANVAVAHPCSRCGSDTLCYLKPVASAPPEDKEPR